MPEHTPGPWKLTRAFGINEWSISGKLYAGRFIGTARNQQEAEANARLVAAAPELLETLKEVIRLSDRKVDEWDRAKEAIAKAEGR